MIFSRKKYYMILFCLILPLCFLYRLGFDIAFPIFFIFVALFGILTVLFDRKEAIYTFFKSLKFIEFKFFWLFIIWVILATIVSIFTGKIFWPGAIRAVLGGLVFSIIGVGMSVFYCAINIKDTRFISKIMLIAFFAIFMLGIVNFLGDLFNISIFKIMISILSGHKDRIILMNKGFPRIYSLFSEPSHLGYFIIVSIPFIIYLCANKIKIFNNVHINKFLKILTPILMLINLILTQSPIFVPIGFILFGFFINKIYLKRKSLTLFFGLFLTVCLISIFIINKDNLSKTFLNRAIAVVTTVHNGDLNMDNLINVDPSLASRLICFSNDILLFSHNPIFGVGYGNRVYHMTNILYNSSFPLTDELSTKSFEESASFPATIFFRLLSETGFLGMFFFYAMLFSLAGKLRLIVKNLNNNLNYNFIKGIEYSFYVILLTSFYDSPFHINIIHILIGLALSVLYLNYTFERKTLTSNQSVKSLM